MPVVAVLSSSAASNIQLLDEVEQNIVIYLWRADQLFADAKGIKRTMLNKLFAPILCN